MTDLEQRVARAICLGKGVDPDMCVAGSGALPGDPGFVCQQYAWELELPTAKAALKAHAEWLERNELEIRAKPPFNFTVDLAEETSAAQEEQQ